MAVWTDHRTSKTAIAHERVVVVRGKISKKAMLVRTGAALGCRGEKDEVNHQARTNISKNCCRFALGYHWWARLLLSVQDCWRELRGSIICGCGLVLGVAPAPKPTG